MKQKKLSICVYNKDQVLLYEKEIASFQDVNSAISLFDEIGNYVVVTVSEFDPQTLNGHEA